MKKDRFGNLIPRDLDYARGSILKGSKEEELRRIHGLTLVRDRNQKKIFNLTGVTRNSSLIKDDVRKMESWLSATHYSGKAEEMAVKFSGGDPKRHAATVMNRGTSAILAIALCFVKKGENVISITPDGISYPSIARVVEVIGANLVEASPSDIKRLPKIVKRYKKVELLIITPISTRKYHLPLELVKKTLDMGKKHGLLTFLDDAWASLRINVYHEPKTLELGADLALLSPDKYMIGPRAGVVVGRKDLVAEINTRALMFGLESQQSQYVSVYRAFEDQDLSPIRRAGELTDILFKKMKETYDGRAYHLGGGVAMSEEDVLEIACKRTGRQPSITPGEASSAHAMLMLGNYGIVTGLTMIAPGRPPYSRLMLFPDGQKLGVDRIMEAIEDSFDQLAKVIDKPEEARKIILGTKRW